MTTVALLTGIFMAPDSIGKIILSTTHTDGNQRIKTKKIKGKRNVRKKVIRMKRVKRKLTYPRLCGR